MSSRTGFDLTAAALVELRPGRSSRGARPAVTWTEPGDGPAAVLLPRR